jgi:hypothetical protein
MTPPSARSWYFTLVGVILPILLLGFLASALANRIVFAGWAVVSATVLTFVLRRGFESWRGPLAIAWPAALVLGACLGLFAHLVGRHGEILDLGYRAVFPSWYTPWLTSPRTFGLLGVVAAAFGGLLFLRRTF